MANGGMISCLHCTYGRGSSGMCDVFGIEVSAFILCHTFRTPRQSHVDARKKWPILNELEPGVIYNLDNSYPQKDPDFTPIYRIDPIYGDQ